MPRPHIPVAIRRRTLDGMIEVQTKGGNWIPYGLLSAPSLTTLCNDVLKGRTIPLHDPFHFTGDDRINDDAPTFVAPPIEPNDADQTDQTDQTDQDDDMPDQDDQDDDMPNDNDATAPMTIDDIVRRIAGRMDAEMAKDLLALVDEKLSSYQPTTDSTSLVPVLTNVTIHRPNVAPLPVDGLFHREFPTLLRLVANGAHVYLPGSPGTGKSHAAEQAAQMLGRRFGSISFGPTTPESRLVGGMTANGEFFEPMLLNLVRYAMDNPDSGAIMCLDEIDNGHPGVQATLNSLLANGWMTAPNGDHLTVGDNMVFIACANTYGTGPTAEFSGRNKLDAATLDRFMYLPWEIDTGVEEVLVRRRIADSQVADAWLDVWRTTRKNVADHGLKIFVTPRGAVNGAKLIGGGFDIETAYKLVLGNKVPADQLAKINPF